MEQLLEILKENPVIMSIDSNASMDLAIKCHSKVVMTIYGDVLSIVGIIRKLQKSGKIVFVNIDLIQGFAPKNPVVDFLDKFTKDIIIVSQKAALLRYAKDKGFVTMHRFFIVDSHAYRGIGKQVSISKADFVNIAPAWSQTVGWAIEQYDVKVISSGMITTQATVDDNLEAGAVAVCTTNKKVWALTEDR